MSESKSKIISMDKALDLIKDNAVMASSGFIMAGTAEAIFKKLGERYKKTGHPANLTMVFAASAGNGEGLGCDHLCQDGMIKRIIGGHFGLCPNMGKYIADNKCEAYNFPLGIVPALYRGAIQGHESELSKVGIGTFIDPRIEGGRLNSATKENIIKVVNVDGEEYLSYPIPKFDIAIIRGTTGDADGNISIDHEISKFELKAIAMAVHAHGGKVIVQVKDIAAPGTLTAKQIEIPGIFVDAVVIAPDPETEHRQTKAHFYKASMSGHINIPLEAIEPLKLDVRKVIARRCAMELVPNAVVNLGIGVPEGVAVVAAEEGFGDQLVLTTESGILGGVPCGGEAFGAGENAMGIFDMRTMFDFYDGGGLDLTVLGLAECNAKGDINVSRFGPKTPGAGGFINISQNTHKVVFCGAFTAGGTKLKIGDGRIEVITEGKNKKFVKDVQQITFSSKYALSINQDVIYVTERAVFKLMPDGITLIEIAPGIDLEKDILNQMEFSPIISKDLKFMDERIFRDEKMGLELK